MSPAFKRKTGRFLWTLVLVTLVAVEFWFRSVREPPAKEPAVEIERLQPLSGVRFIDAETNDGDSFVVDHEGQKLVLRLYFVDCAEKREYKLVAGRLKDQAGYFGGLSIPQTLKLGQQARAFTADLLRSRAFTVFTRWERVYDSDRIYAVIVFEDGEDLAHKLVQAGLARIHTKGVNMPNGRKANDYENHLRDVEKQARAAKRGAWGMPRRALSTPKAG
ncbi:MAG: thermonuclease family protein [Prosthecobacter sp.]